MTPIEIEIMLHYYSRANDFRDGDFNAPAVEVALAKLVNVGLLAHGPNLRVRGYLPTHYHITEGGEVYVRALKAVPLPVRQWVMPKANAS